MGLGGPGRRRHRLPDGRHRCGRACRSRRSALAVWLLFLLAVRGLVALHAAVARALLSASPDPVMTARVAAAAGLARPHHRRGRRGAPAARARPARRRAAAARRRSRCSSASSSGGSPRARTSPTSSRAADAELRAAIAELRDLARGIHPAVLTDRGLAPALRDVAQRAALPVELDALPDERLPGPVEAAAYFTVSEALTNVARYAQATRRAGRRADRRRATRDRGADDGVGGALAGQRLGAGRARGPARRARRRAAGRLAARRGDDASRRRSRSTSPSRTEALDEAARTGEPGGLRRRVLQSHAVVYALVMALLVFIWLTTGGRLLLAAVGDRGLGTAARAPRLVRASASRGYARRTDAS